MMLLWGHWWQQLNDRSVQKGISVNGGKAERWSAKLDAYCSKCYSMFQRLRHHQVGACESLGNGCCQRHVGGQCRTFGRSVAEAKTATCSAFIIANGGEAISKTSGPVS